MYINDCAIPVQTDMTLSHASTMISWHISFTSST